MISEIFNEFALWQINALVITLGLVFSTIGIVVVDRFYTIFHLRENNHVGGFKFEFLEPFFLSFLLLPLTLSWVDYNDLNRNVGLEGSSLIFLKNIAAVFDEPVAVDLKDAIDRYATAVTVDEWRTMEQGKESKKAADALQVLVLRYGQVQPRTAHQREMLKTSASVLGHVVKYRGYRLAAAIHPNGLLVSGGLVISVILTIALGWVFALPTLLTKVALQALLVVAMMCCVFFVLTLSFPFKGDLYIPPHPFLRVLN